MVVALDALPESFHGDPADRLIVASAQSHGLPLATKDRAIQASGVVPTWNAPARAAASQRNDPTQWFLPDAGGFLSGPAPFSNPPINQSCVSRARRAIATRQSLLVTGLDPNPE